MERLTKQTYELDLTKSEMKKLGFRYDYDLENYVYKFPVYRNMGIPLIFCKLGVNEETNILWFTVCNSNDTLYASYYNKEYGRNSMIIKIEHAIQNKLNRIGATKV